MAINYQNNGNGTATLTLTYTVPKARLDAVLLDAAHYLFDAGYGNHGTHQAPRVWEDLSTQERLALIDEATKRDMMDRAKSYHLTQAAETARNTASNELGSYDL